MDKKELWNSRLHQRKYTIPSSTDPWSEQEEINFFRYVIAAIQEITRDIVEDVRHTHLDHPLFKDNTPEISQLHELQIKVTALLDGSVLDRSNDFKIEDSIYLCGIIYSTVLFAKGK